MSLKALHVIFVTAAVLLCVFQAVWFGIEFALRGQRWGDLALGLLSVAGAAALVVYGRRFLEKLKHISYL
jgi:steroid 5-alpha reductase family enzyme